MAFLTPQVLFYAAMFLGWFPYRDPTSPAFWLVLGLVGFFLFYGVGSMLWGDA